MKLPVSQTASFLSAPPATTRVFLFYGPDSGLVHERADALAARFTGGDLDPFAVTSFSGDALGTDAARLFDEMSAIPLLGGRRIVRLYQASDSNAGAVGAFLKDPCAGDSLLIIEAGALSARSKLRALCEKEAVLAVAIPCYLEDASQRQRTIAALLEGEGFRVAPDALRLLSDCLPPDRMALRGEVEKLALYAHGKKEIDETDVRAVIANAGGAEIDDLVMAVAEGEAGRVALLLDALAEQSVSPVALLRAVQRHLMRLHLARGFMEEGASASAAVKKLVPPVFWKNVDPMTRQLRRWERARLEARLADLTQAEAEAKRTGMPDDTLCAHLLLTMAAKS